MNDILCGNDAFTSAWYAVARSIDVGAQPQRVKLLNRDVVLYRGPNGTVVAAPDKCPHRQAPLSKGTVESGCLVCPYHGWTFGDGGTCVDVPSATRGVPAPPRAHLQPYRASERYGLVFVCVGEPRAPVPTIVQESDPTFRRINTEVDV